MSRQAIKVTEWHRYKQGYHQEMKCLGCKVMKPFGQLSIGWWKRFNTKINRTEHRCPKCGRGRKRKLMSHSRTLEEYTENELHDELKRRAFLKSQNKCIYCGREINAQPPCKFSEWHKGND